MPTELPIDLPIVLPIRTDVAWGAKGPGPDRLGLGGPGSWAGPAWLGAPKVLGRTGLAGGAKGPGPGRLGSSNTFYTHELFMMLI